jgi:hypothetical protein
LGAAKAKRDHLKAMMIAESRLLEAPISEAESALALELDSRPTVRIRRAPREQLEWQRMKPRECHQNVSFMVKADPVPGRTKWVLGWMASPQGYVLHSIIEQNGMMICVTPDMFGVDEFDFIKDEKLELILLPREPGSDEQKFRFEREGADMPFKQIRRDHEMLKKQAQWIRDQLEAGVHPLDLAQIAMPKEISVRAPDRPVV